MSLLVLWEGGALKEQETPPNTPPPTPTPVDLFWLSSNQLS